MGTFWSLEPEVAGEIGDGTVMDTSLHPPEVCKLVYRMMGWLGDDLLESFPCYVVTGAVAADLDSSGLSGFVLDDVEIEVDRQFTELYPNRRVPPFRWLRVFGEAGIDDFGISSTYTLVVSDSALALLQRNQLAHCDIEEYGP